MASKRLVFRLPWMWRSTEKPNETLPAPVSALEILPGTQYCRYALPIDYLPSRDFTPRWGASRPPYSNWKTGFVPMPRTIMH